METSSMDFQYRLPVIGSPMFIISEYKAVIAQCLSGIIGTFPSLNARPEDQLDVWCKKIQHALDEARQKDPHAIVSPYGVNLILHQTNLRLEHDIRVIAENRVPLIITSLRAPKEAVQEVHKWGGKVFHDVISKRHAEKAAEAGADGLILVSAGAGGHTGNLNPFAFLAEVREWFKGTIILAGSITSGKDILAARLLGADFVYMGTRFIATKEMGASDAYKQMIVDSTSADIVYSSFFTGVHANYLTKSIEQAGIDLEALKKKPTEEFGFSKAADSAASAAKDKKAWKDIWSAGHGVANIHDIPSVSELVDRLSHEYEAAKSTIAGL